MLLALKQFYVLHELLQFFLPINQVILAFVKDQSTMRTLMAGILSIAFAMGIHAHSHRKCPLASIVRNRYIGH